MELKHYFAQDTEGNVIPGAAVYLYKAGTNEIATGLEDKDGSPMSVPFNADADGFIEFAAPNGDYDLRVISGQRQFELRISFYQPGDPSDLVVTPEGGGEARSLAEWTSEIPEKKLSVETVRVPSQFATLQEAINYTSGILFYEGSGVDVLIESGHSPESGVLLYGGDYSKVTIKSEDAVVMLPESFSSDDFISMTQGNAPVLGCLVDAGYYCRYGYYVTENGGGVVLPNCGVERARSIGLHARHASTVTAGGSMWRNSGNEAGSAAILAWGATINATGANFSDAFYYGAEAAAGGSINVRDGIGTNCGEYAIRGTNAGIVNARDADVSGSKIGVRSFDGSLINARGANADGCEVGFFAQHASTINAMGSSAKNCTSAGYQALDSTIECEDGDASGSSNGISALRGARVTAFGVKASGCTNRAVSAQNGSTVYADGGADFSDCSGSISVEVVTGSKVMARAADISGASGVPVYCSQSEGVFTGSDVSGAPNNKLEVYSGSNVIFFSSGLDPDDTNVSAFNSNVGFNGVVWSD